MEKLSQRYDSIRTMNKLTELFIVQHKLYNAYEACASDYSQSV